MAIAATNTMPQTTSQRIGPRTEDALGLRSIRSAVFPPRPVGVGAEVFSGIAPSRPTDTTVKVEGGLARPVSERLARRFAYSTRAPANLTTFSHFSVSEAITWPKSAGE